MVTFAKRLLALGFLPMALLGAGREPAAAHAHPTAEPSARPASPTPTDDDLHKSAKRTREQPTDAGAWVAYGDALMQRSREQPAGTWYEQAESAYRQALRLNPKEVGALVGRAWVCNSRHEFDEGRRWAREALLIDPKTPDAHALIGDAAVECGDYDEAFDHYQACLDIRPDLSSYARSAHLLWLTGDARRAKALLRKAIAAGSLHAENTAWCRAELALMMFHSGALVLAEKEIHQAVAAAPANPHVLAVQGRIKAAQKDYAAAIDCYERALAGGVPEMRTMAALVDLYQMTGETARAEAVHTRMLDVHSAQADAHHHAGDADADHAHPHSHWDAEFARYLADQGGDPERALQEARSAAVHSHNVYVTDALAWCYYQAGDYENARQTILKALRWNTPDASLMFHAGQIYAKLGNRPAAQRYLYQALSLNPRFHPRDAAVAVKTLAQLSKPVAAAEPAADDEGARPPKSPANATP